MQGQIGGAQPGGIRAHQSEQHQPGADRRLGQNEDEAPARGAPHRVTAREDPPGPHEQDHDREQRDSARQRGA